MAFLSDFFLFHRFGQSEFSCTDLFLVNICQSFVVNYIIVGFHYGQADVGFSLLLL